MTLTKDEYLALVEKWVNEADRDRERHADRGRAAKQRRRLAVEAVAVILGKRACF